MLHETQPWKMDVESLSLLHDHMERGYIKFTSLSKRERNIFKKIIKQTIRGMKEGKHKNELMDIATRNSNKIYRISDKRNKPIMLRDNPAH